MILARELTLTLKHCWIYKHYATKMNVNSCSAVRFLVVLTGVGPVILILRITLKHSWGYI